MNSLELQKLVKYKIIDDYFDYQDLDEEIVKKYKYFEEKFETLLSQKVTQYNLIDSYFMINNNFHCNAFAKNKKGYNIIGVTSGYAIKMLEIFDEKNFRTIIQIGLMNDAKTSEAYANLYNLDKFKYNDFMLNCSIQFTFGHEFQHILQFNSSKIKTENFRSENCDKVDFNMKFHAWEFDADRFGAFEVMKYIFEIKNEIKVKDNKMFLCLFYLGLASLFITKTLFYFKIESSTQKFSRTEFYTKKYSHPHPIIRLFNIIDYFFDNVRDYFPNLEADKQDFLNNVLGILKIYFNSYMSQNKIIEEIFGDVEMHLTEINNYNHELYEYAIKESSIRQLLINRKINYK